MSDIYYLLGKEVVYSVALVGLSFLFVCLLSKLLKTLRSDCNEFYGGIRGGKRNKWLDFGSESPAK